VVEESTFSLGILQHHSSASLGSTSSPPLGVLLAVSANSIHTCCVLASANPCHLKIGKKKEWTCVHFGVCNMYRIVDISKWKD
jgi:hypothetical protein